MKIADKNRDDTTKDNSKINININLNWQKTTTHVKDQSTSTSYRESQILGRKLDNSGVVKVNTRKLDQIPRQGQLDAPESLPDFSNVSINQKENEKVYLNKQNPGTSKVLKDKLKKMLVKSNKKEALQQLLNIYQPNLNQIHSLIRYVTIILLVDKRTIYSKQSNTPQTFTQSQSLNQTSSLISKAKKKKKKASVHEFPQEKKEKKSRSKSNPRGQKKNSSVIEEVNKSKSLNSNINDLIKNNLKKKSSRKCYNSPVDKEKKSVEKKIQQEVDKNVKKKELVQKNHEIRQLNAERFYQQKSKSKKCTDPQMQIPWGLNQERLKAYLAKQYSLYQQNMIIQQNRINKPDQDYKQRREQLGVSFLNHYDESSVQQIISSNKFSKKQT